MIPTIETIVDDLVAGLISKAQAVAWLHQHAETAYASLRDDFAASALSLIGPMAAQRLHDIKRAGMTAEESIASDAYAIADAIMAVRSKA